MGTTQELRQQLGLLSEEDLRALLGHKNIATVRTWRKKGIGPEFTRLGKTPFYRKADVEEWIVANVQDRVSSDTNPPMSQTVRDYFADSPLTTDITNGAEQDESR